MYGDKNDKNLTYQRVKATLPHGRVMKIESEKKRKFIKKRLYLPPNVWVTLRLLNDDGVIRQKIRTKYPIVRRRKERVVIKL